MLYNAITSQPSPQAVAEQLYANAYAALEEGRAKDAQRQFTLMAAVVPKDERCWVGFGAALEQAGETERALKAYSTGTSVAPQSVFCKLGQARALFKLGKVQEAHLVLDRAELDTNEVSDVHLIDRMRSEL